jgi:hypothetical protein
MKIQTTKLELRTPNSVSTTTTTVRRLSNTILIGRLKSTITSFSVFVLLVVCLVFGVRVWRLFSFRHFNFNRMGDGDRSSIIAAQECDFPVTKVSHMQRGFM